MKQSYIIYNPFLFFTPMKNPFLKLTSISLMGLIVMMSCSKDKNREHDNNQNSGPNYVYKASFDGTFLNYETTFNVMGGVFIEDNNNIIIDVLAGEMKGTATKIGDNYQISIIETKGIFQNINNLQGEINAVSETLTITGTNPDGSEVVLNGEVQLQTTGGWENLAKTRVYFQHAETGRTVSITINGETYSGLERIYQLMTDGGMWYDYGFCGNDYSSVQLLANVDGKESPGLLCYTGTLKMLDGSYEQFTKCDNVGYFLNKNTTYTYTANWDNGETTTGTFTTGDGGSGLGICLKLNDGAGSQSGTGHFTINGITYYGECYAEIDNELGCNGKMYVEIDTDDAYIEFSAVPTSQGTYSIGVVNENYDLNCNVIQALANFDNLDYELLSQSGSFEKTSATTFSFSSTFKLYGLSTTYTITGAGSW